jgi:putative heme transporter
VSSPANEPPRIEVVPPGLRSLASWGWRLLVVAAAAYLIVLAVGTLRLVVIPVVLATIFAAVLSGPNRRLRRLGVPAALAALIVLVGSLGSIVGAVYFAVRAAGGQFAEIGESLQEGLEQLQERITEPPFNLEPGAIDDLRDSAMQAITDNRAGLASGAVQAGTIAIEVLIGLALFVVLLFFFLRDGGRIWRWLVLLLPAGPRQKVDTAGRVAARTLSGYVSGTAVVATVDAVGIAIALLIIGVPLVFPLSVLVFLGAFIPVIGAFVTGFLAVIVALVSEGLTAALLVVVAITVVQQVESNLLQPVVMGRALRLHPVVVLLAFTSGSVLAGFAGALFAVPFVAVCSNIVAALRGYPDYPPPDVDGEGSAPAENPDAVEEPFPEDKPSEGTSEDASAGDGDEGTGDGDEGTGDGDEGTVASGSSRIGDG